MLIKPKGSTGVSFAIIISSLKWILDHKQKDHMSWL